MGTLCNRLPKRLPIYQNSCYELIQKHDAQYLFLPIFTAFKISLCFMDIFSDIIQDPTTVGSIGDLIFRLIQKDSSQYNRASINVQNKSGEFNVKIVYKKRKV